jgi:hypothetical protein
MTMSPRCRSQTLFQWIPTLTHTSIQCFLLKVFHHAVLRPRSNLLRFLEEEQERQYQREDKEATA